MRVATLHLVSRFAETKDVNPKSLRHTVGKLRLQPCTTFGCAEVEVVDRSRMPYVPTETPTLVGGVNRQRCNKK